MSLLLVLTNGKRSEPLALTYICGCIFLSGIEGFILVNIVFII